MRELKVKESVNILSLSFLIFLALIFGVFGIGISLVIVKEGLYSIIPSKGISGFIVAIIMFLGYILASGTIIFAISSEIKKFKYKNLILEMDAQGIKCVNHRTQTIEYISWDKVDGVNYNRGYSKYEIAEVIIFVSEDYKGNCEKIQFTDKETGDICITKAVRVSTEEAKSKTKKIYDTIAYNINLYE